MKKVVELIGTFMKSATYFHENTEIFLMKVNIGTKAVLECINYIEKVHMLTLLFPFNSFIICDILLSNIKKKKKKCIVKL